MAQCIQQIFFDPRSSKVILLHPVQLRVALKQQRSNKQTCMGSFGNRSSSVVNNCKHMIPRQWDSTWSVGFFSKVSVRPKSLYLTQCVNKLAQVVLSKRAWSHIITTLQMPFRNLSSSLVNKDTLFSSPAKLMWAKACSEGHPHQTEQ